MPLLSVNATDLEQKVSQVEEVNPKKRILLYTVDPETEDSGPTCYSIPWSSTILSGMIKAYKEALPPTDDEEEGNNDDDDEDDDGMPRPVTRFTVPDCEAEPLKLIAMYLQYYADKPEYVGVAPLTTTKPSSAAHEPAAPSANANDDDDDAVRPSLRMRGAAEDPSKKDEDPSARLKTVGAHNLERPYKPAQMEVDLKKVAGTEPCLDGYEKYLAQRINEMDKEVAVRTLRCMLCAGWFLNMNTSFLDLTGWLLSLRFRGNNVHQIKEMMKDENISVRKDHI